jgi:hypothetical protein
MKGEGMFKLENIVLIMKRMMKKDQESEVAGPLSNQGSPVNDYIFSAKFRGMETASAGYEKGSWIVKLVHVPNEVENVATTFMYFGTEEEVVVCEHYGEYEYTDKNGQYYRYNVKSPND